MMEQIEPNYEDLAIPIGREVNEIIDGLLKKKQITYCLI